MKENYNSEIVSITNSELQELINNLNNMFLKSWTPLFKEDESYENWSEKRKIIYIYLSEERDFICMEIFISLIVNVVLFKVNQKLAYYILMFNGFIWILNFMKINYDNIVLISISLLSLFIFFNLKKSKKKKVLKQIKKFI